MEIIPKNYIKELDLVIVFTNKDKIYANLLTRRTQAKKYYFIYHKY